MTQKIAEIKKIIVPILKKNDVLKSSIFGSVARGDQNKKSDIDILIQPKKGTTMFGLIYLERALQKKLKRKVDLVTYNSVHPLLKDRVYKDEIVIYEKRR